MNLVRKHISLVLTQKCNLSCVYCYENYKSKKEMKFDTAIKIVEQYLSSSSTEYDECEIDLFGGEPFLNFPLMKEMCEFVWSKTWNKPYIFFATTNGTLIHGEIQKWLYKNRNRFFLSLSLDGTKEMHDINRNDSFNKIDLEFFKNTWDNLKVKMTISQETLPYLAQGVIFLHSLGFSIQNNFAYGIDWSNPINVNALERELKELINYYLLHPEVAPCELLNMKIEHLNSNHQDKKWCGTGTHMKVFDIDGIDYPCQAFLPMSIGKDKALKSKEIDFNMPQLFVDPKCNRCILHSICPTCYGSNYERSGKLATRDEYICKLTKVRALANSYFATGRILANSKIEKLEGKDYLIVKSALVIQNQIKL